MSRFLKTLQYTPSEDTEGPLEQDWPPAILVPESSPRTPNWKVTNRMERPQPKPATIRREGSSLETSMSLLSSEEDSLKAEQWDQLPSKTSKILSTHSSTENSAQELSTLSSVPEEDEALKDPKVLRLQEVFGFQKSPRALKRALDEAQGSMDEAIRLAVIRDFDDDDYEAASHLPQANNEHTLPSSVFSSSPLIVQPKKRRLIKKKDLPVAVPEPSMNSKAKEESKSSDIEFVSEASTFSKTGNLQKPVSNSRSINLVSEDTSSLISSSVQIPVSKKQERTSRQPVEVESDEESFATEEETDSEEEEDGDEFITDSKTLEFFNSCTLDQLTETTGCSEDQANFIIGLRPFEDMSHLRSSLASGRKKMVHILDKYEETMEGYAQVDTLIERCRKYGEDLEVVLNQWGLSNLGDVQGELSMINLPPLKENEVAVVDDDSSHEPILLRQQPDFISDKVKLKSYQLLGISWLYLLYSKGLSGILADEMGLGKTAQVISLLGYLKSKGFKGPHMIVAPSSTLENWLREIEKWCPHLTYRSYYGSQNERLESQDEIRYNIRDIDIIVTTYNMATGNKDDRAFLRKLNCVSMILDEGHMIKNMESNRYKYLSKFNAKFRLLMTGTPLQNNLMELLSLLNFILPDLFSSDMEALDKIFNVKRSAARGEQSLLCKQRIQRAKEIMTPFVLRRRKDQVVKELPPKIVTIQRCDLTPNQHTIYHNVLKESKRSYLQATSVEAKTKTLKKQAQSGANKQLTNVLMELRKISNHPLLVRHFYEDDMLRKMARQIMREPEYCEANRDYIFEDMQYLSDFELHSLCKKFKSIHSFRLKEEQWMDAGKVQMLKQLLPAMRDRGDRVLIFSQFVIMLNVLEEVMTTLGMKYLRLDGQTNVSERQGLIDLYNNDDSINVFLISTKAGGVGINLTSANVVILYDMDFNPHNDKQAEDRAHRVGQTRDVNVIKLVMNDTIEEHILRCAITKIKLDEQIRGGTDEESSEVDQNVLEALRNDMKAEID